MRARRLYALLGAAIVAAFVAVHSLGARLLSRRKETPRLHALSIVNSDAAPAMHEEPPPSTTPSPPTRSTNRSRAKAPIAVDRSDSIDTSHGDADESAEAIISDDCQLLFVMPTVAREGRANYLNSTLDALLCQLRSAPHESLRVCIGVFEPRPQAVTPTPFELARRSLAKAPANVRNRVLFVRASDDASSSSSSSQALRGTIRRALKSADDAVSRLGKLGLTKRQTVDVARMLLAFQTRSSRYLVLMEDDWLLCDGGMDALRYLITKASLYHGANNWAALRFSYGLNGILVQTSDILPLPNSYWTREPRPTIHCTTRLLII